MNVSVNRKIISGPDLAERLAPTRKNGRTVVQCHGCFDIVHPGHVRYLQFARSLGDVLIVSLTGDALMSKGADRPYIPQELRAENLAALEFVDWVVVDPHPTACELLALIRPSVYVKGREYAGSSDPRFLREQELVERHGGRVVFHSGEVVFSSSRLIQGLARDAELDECRLAALCRRHDIDQFTLRGALHKMEGVPVVVVGDVLRERSVICDAGGPAPDAPVLTLQQIDQTDAWGGAAALALQLSALGARPRLISIAPDDDDARALRDTLERSGVELELLPSAAAIPTHTTFISDDAKLLRLQQGAAAPLDSRRERALLDAVRGALDGARLLVWNDCGYGVVSPGLVAGASEQALRRGIYSAAQARGPRGVITNLRRANLLVCSERHAREALHDPASGLPSVVWNLLLIAQSTEALVGLHKRGVIAFDGHGDAAAATDTSAFSLQRLRSEYVPNLAAHFTDLLGADLALLAVAALVRATGGSLALGAYLGAAAQSIAMGRSGSAPVNLDVLGRWLSGRAELAAPSRFAPQPQPAQTSPARSPQPAPAVDEPQAVGAGPPRSEPGGR